MLMSCEPIEREVLDTFISQKYHWHTLTPEQQMSMAVELQKHRFLEKHYMEFIDQIMADKNAFRRYRGLVSGDR
jgi:hypothetical protein